ncbi:MAG: alpha/beta hydrolase [Caldisericia bacterium]|nr:alpha/beta hydrolase [Caldisericia bacterium]
MKKIIISLSLVLVFVFSFLKTKPAMAEECVRYLMPCFSEVIQTDSIVYKEAKDIHGNPISLSLIVVEPKGDNLEKRPLAIWIHGGGFISGKKEGMLGRCIAYAKMGYVAVTIQYRLSATDKSSWVETDTMKRAVDDAVEDARSAVDWLRAHATEYRIDTNQIFIGGSSAGAITSLHVAYQDDGWNKTGMKGVIDLWGALLSDVQIDSTEPPVIIIHGTEDTTVPFKLSLALVKKLKEAKVPYLFYPVKGVGHGVPAPNGQAFHYIEALFIYQYLE